MEFASIIAIGFTFLFGIGALFEGSIYSVLFGLVLIAAAVLLAFQINRLQTKQSTPLAHGFSLAGLIVVFLFGFLSLPYSPLMGIVLIICAILTAKYIGKLKQKLHPQVGKATPLPLKKILVAFIILIVVVNGAGLLIDHFKTKCGENECGLKGKCYTKPAHSHCAYFDFKNAWICDENFLEKDDQCTCPSGRYACKKNTCGSCDRLKPPSYYLPVCFDDKSCKESDAYVTRYNQCLEEYKKCVEQKCECS